MALLNPKFQNKNNHKFTLQKIIQPALLLFALTSAVSHAVDFSLFGDVSLQNSSAKDKNSSFSLGALDFFAAQRVNDNTFGLVELVFENNGDGFVVDLERLWIEHVFSDRFKLAAGRFHTPIGYWNRNLHHGAILQDTVSRPFFLDFEDGDTGILPVHVIGLMAKGLVLADSEALNYEVIISNGPSLDSSGGLNPGKKPTLDPNNISDNNANKSITARFTYSPEDSDWSLGVFTMQHNIGESSNNGLTAKGDTLVKQAIYGADFYYQHNQFDLLSEVYFLQNDEKGSPHGQEHGVHSSTAFYVQPGYKLSDKMKLVYRYSQLSFDNDDTYYQILKAQEQIHQVAGIRYDIDGYNTIKFEYSHSNNEHSNNYNTVTLQWSFLLQ
ncbi:MAG: hypothetical protein JKX78_12495 [Alteromonadaceae bacterium]|nr:hypothetical protein [Alteromonadaceae bacterium]